MAERKPLVVINGELQELPDSDTIDVNTADLNIDGGSASSVYLSTQKIDGGDANG